jgi:branched-chain amino acid transport system permease protein
MRFLFKTGYEQDLRLAKHDGHRFWYGLLGLLLLAAPWLLSEYLLAQLTFILIYSVVGLGLMLLAGFTGLFSIGHAAFLGVGAYTQAVLTQMGWPFPLAMAMAGLLSAAVGVVVGLPALRRLVLFRVPGRHRAGHAGLPEPAALAHGPGVCGHP